MCPDKIGLMQMRESDPRHAIKGFYDLSSGEGKKKGSWEGNDKLLACFVVTDPIVLCNVLLVHKAMPVN